MPVFPLDKRQHPDFSVPGKPVGAVEVDRDNKFGKHLEAGYLLKEIGAARDVTGRYHATTAGADLPVLRGGEDGLHQDWSVTGNYTNRYNIDSEKLRELFNGTNAFTLLFHARADSVANNSSVVFSLDGADDFILYLSVGATRQFRLFWRNVITSTSLSFEQDGTEYQGTWNKYGYTFDGIDQHKLFINGDNVDDVIKEPTNAGPYSTGPAIAGWAGNQGFKDDLSSVLLFNKDFSSSIRELSEDPYQTLKPVVDLQWFSGAGVEPPTGFKPYYAANVNTIIQGF